MGVEVEAEDIQIKITSASFLLLRSGGGVVEKSRLNLTSAKVKVEVEAELGNILRATTSINFKHFGNNEWMR